MAIIGIVAVDRKGAIGRGGTVPWHYSSDLKFFKRQTLHHVCVMGRQTWHSLKRPLPERLNIVMSRAGMSETPPGVIVLRDKPAVLSLKEYLSGDLFIIGGEQIFRAFLPEIEQWIVTEVPLSIEDADTFMPADYLQGFEPFDAEQLEDDLRVTFYRRVSSSS